MKLRVLSAVLLLLFAQSSGAFAGTCLCLTCSLGTHRAFEMRTAEMLPTLAPSNCVIGRIFDPNATPLRYGDVVTYKPSRNATSEKMARILALGGDLVAVNGGRIQLNGVDARYSTPAIVQLTQFSLETAPCGASADAGGKCAFQNVTEQLTTPGANVSHTIFLPANARTSPAPYTLRILPEYVWVMPDHRALLGDGLTPKGTLLPITAITTVIVRTDD